MEIGIPIVKEKLEPDSLPKEGLLRFVIDDTGINANVPVNLDFGDEEEVNLGTVEFSQLQKLAKSITGLGGY